MINILIQDVPNKNANSSIFLQVVNSDNRQSPDMTVHFTNMKYLWASSSTSQLEIFNGGWAVLETLKWLIDWLIKKKFELVFKFL